MNNQLLKLENQLCFPLYAAAKGVVARYKPFLDEIGLTYTQYIAMMVLWEHRIVSVKDMGQLLYLDSGTLTPLLKRLESKGLVQRARDAQDERVVNIQITDEGLQLKERAALIPPKMKDCISLSVEDTTSLYTILHKLLATLE